MRVPRLRRRQFALILFALFGLLFDLPAAGQQAGTPFLVTQAVNDADRVTLRGNTHPLARAEFDHGAAPDDLPMRRMLLLLKRSPDQQLALAKLLEQQQTKSSPEFHHWLTPEEFGEQFGPADSDIQAVTDWLASEGFEVDKVSAGRSVIEFSGTAGQVRSALHTEIHKYVVNGHANWANSSDPQIPSPLAPVVDGFVSLNNFPRKPMSHTLGPFARSAETGQIQPLYTLTYPDVTYYIVGPGDFSTIYNVAPLWQAGIDCSGQTIAIVAESNINPNDNASFRAMWNLPYKQPQIILNGPDPGIIQGPESESNLDVQWSGAVAKGANINLIVSESTEASSGIDLSSLYIIYNNIAPIMSVSYGGCESDLGVAGNAYFNSLWQQGSAEGITILVSSGDSGSDVCDYSKINQAGWATTGLSVNGLATTPFDVAVGGTDFNDVANPGTYWSSTNNTTTHGSAKSYVPEMTWNSGCASLGLTGCASLRGNGIDLLAGSGGPSACTMFSSGNCAGGYPKPPWQTGVGVPGDGVRDIPDVSLFAAVASNTSSFYPYCEADELQGYSCSFGGAFLGAGGTSVSAQAFAGIVALLLQKTGGRMGNINFVLYPLAAKSGASCAANSAAVGKASCIFYDTVTGNNSVACIAGSPNCSKTTAGTGYGVLVNPNAITQPAWLTTSGYDLATGLGTVNAANMVNGWGAVSFGPTTTTLSLSTTPPTNPLTVVHGQPVNFDIGVTATGGTPTGSVALLAGPISSSPNSGSATLSGGAASGTTVFLPGGSYGVTAHYAGDGTFGASDSTPPIQVTVTPESSKTKVGLVTFDFNTGQITSTSATSAPYGSLYLLRTDVTNSSGNLCFPDGSIPHYDCPSGTVTLTENGSVMPHGTISLNSQGYGENQSIQLAAGAHPVVASYGGDASYNTSMSPTSALSITPGPTTTTITGIPSTIVAGSALAMDVKVRTQSYGSAPLGSVQTFIGTAEFGMGGIINQQGGSANGPAFINAFLSGFLPSQTQPGPQTITAKYPGDSNYSSSVSSAATLTILDYTFTANPGTLTIPAPGQSASTTLTVSPLYGLTGIVNLSCNNDIPHGITCSISPAAVNLTNASPVTATLTITTTAASPLKRGFVRVGSILENNHDGLSQPASSEGRLSRAEIPRVAGLKRAASLEERSSANGSLGLSNAKLPWLWMLVFALLVAFAALQAVKLRDVSASSWIPAFAGISVVILMIGFWVACGGGGGGTQINNGPIPAARVSITPFVVSFGQAETGSISSVSSVFLLNSGTANLSISSIAITGTNPTDFLELHDCGNLVPPGSGCTFLVSFAPSSLGARAAQLTITDNASGSPQQVSLNGTGIAPTISLSPSSLSFGPQETNFRSDPKTVTLTNLDSTVLTNPILNFTGTNSSDFVLASDCYTVAAGGHCSINIYISPQGPGTRTAQLVVSKSVIGSHITVDLTGTGVQPTISITPSSLTFANQNLFTQSAPHMVTIANTSTLPVLMNSTFLSGPNSPDFYESYAPPSWWPIMPVGGSMQFMISFTPSNTGSRTAQISISDNATGYPQIVPITGTGQMPPTPPGTYPISVNATYYGTSSYPDSHTLQVPVTVQ